MKQMTIVISYQRFIQKREEFIKIVFDQLETDHTWEELVIMSCECM